MMTFPIFNRPLQFFQDLAPFGAPHVDAGPSSAAHAAVQLHALRSVGAQGANNLGTSNEPARIIGYPLAMTNIAMENDDLMGKTIGKW